MKQFTRRGLRRLMLAMLATFGGGALAQNYGVELLPVSARFLYALLPPASITSVNANGWTVEYPSAPTLLPDTAPILMAVARAGFDATGTATTFVDSLVLTKRTRLPLTYTATKFELTPQTVALSDYVYATDQVAGVVNNSTELSPKPIANWVTPDRSIIPRNDILTIELQAFHRDGRNNQQVAAVIFSASDGVHAPVTQTVSAMIVSANGSNDRHAVLVYQANLDVSGLSDNALITVNAKVYPWVGASNFDYAKSSVTDSALSGADRSGFSPRFYMRNTSRAASVPRAYVNCYVCAYSEGATATGGGNNATGQWSQDDATARSRPFEDIKSAIQAVNDPARGIGKAGMLSPGFIDGVEVRVAAGTYDFALINGVKSQALASLIVTRDPIVSRAKAIVRFNTTATANWYNGRVPVVGASSLEFRDLRLLYTSDVYVRGASTTGFLELALNNVDADFNEASNIIGLQYGTIEVFGANLYGITPSNVKLLSGSGNLRIGRLRGLQCRPECRRISVKGVLLTGSDLDNLTSATGVNGWSIISYNSFRTNLPTGYNLISGGGLGDQSGAALIQNTFDTVDAPALLRISGDLDRSSLEHFVMQHNSFTGFSLRGRSNMGYDNTAGLRRENTLWNVSGNIQVQWNIKSDYFQRYHCNSGSCNDPNPERHTGSWSLYYGVGQRSEFIQFLSRPVGDADHAYWGIGSKVQLDQSRGHELDWNNPRYVWNPQAVEDNGIAGYSNMRLQPLSPVVGMVTTPTLPYDLDGIARGPTTAAGAYVVRVGQ